MMVSSGGTPFVQKKTLRKLGVDVNDVLASGPSDFGVKALKKFGWREGQGLGKNEQGRASYVRVTKKDDKRGIGCVDVNKESFTDNWWQHGFAQAARNVQLKSIGAGSGSDSDSDSESESGCEDSGGAGDITEDRRALKVSLERDMQTYSKEDIMLYKACKGRICGKRAGRIQVGKMLRERKADRAFEQAYSSLTETRASTCTSQVDGAKSTCISTRTCASATVKRLADDAYMQATVESARVILKVPVSKSSAKGRPKRKSKSKKRKRIDEAKEEVSVTGAKKSKKAKLKLKKKKQRSTEKEKNDTTKKKGKKKAKKKENKKKVKE